MAVVFFDLLHVDGKSVLGEPWRDRHNCLHILLRVTSLSRMLTLPTLRLCFGETGDGLSG